MSSRFLLPAFVRRAMLGSETDSPLPDRIVASRIPACQMFCCAAQRFSPFISIFQERDCSGSAGRFAPRRTSCRSSTSQHAATVPSNWEGSNERSASVLLVCERNVGQHCNRSAVVGTGVCGCVCNQLVRAVGLSYRGLTPQSAASVAQCWTMTRLVFLMQGGEWSPAALFFWCRPHELQLCLLCVLRYCCVECPFGASRKLEVASYPHVLQLLTIFPWRRSDRRRSD